MIVASALRESAQLAATRPARARAFPLMFRLVSASFFLDEVSSLDPDAARIVHPQ